MAIEKDNIISASDFNNLKAKIDAECRRRRYIGSVYSLPDQYAYENQPQTNGIIKKEHFQKIAVELDAITGDEYENQNGVIHDEVLSNIDKKIDEIAIYSNIIIGSPYDRILGITGCASSCTGICYDSCATACQENCYNKCGERCENTCIFMCGATCEEFCGAQCRVSCITSCGGSCTTSCGQTCQDGCVVECADNCTWACRFSAF